MPGYAHDVYVSGGTIYVAASNSGLFILRYTGGWPIYLSLVLRNL